MNSRQSQGAESADRRSLADAVRSAREARAWSLEQLSQASGVSKGYLSGIENAAYDRPPSEAKLSALEGALGLGSGSLSHLADWQRTPEKVRAEVAMLREQLEALKKKTGRSGADGLDAREIAGEIPGEGENVLRCSERLQSVPIINAVAAGHPAGFTDLDYPVNVADEYVPAMLSAADAGAFAARVIGGSMEPDYREGDLVVFSPSRTAVAGDDCFIRLEPDHETTFKRIHYEAEDRVRLAPLNPAFAHAERTVDRQQISGLWPAILRIQKIGM